MGLTACFAKLRFASLDRSKPGRFAYANFAFTARRYTLPPISCLPDRDTDQKIEG